MLFNVEFVFNDVENFIKLKENFAKIRIVKMYSYQNKFWCVKKKKKN